MGNTSSQTQISESLMQSTTSVIMQNFSSCGGTVQTNQSISYGTVAGDLTIEDISQDSTQTLSVECITKGTNNADILNQIATTLKQQADSKVSGLTLGFSSSDQTSINRSITNVTNAINLSNIRNSLAASITNQSISVQSVGGNATLRRIPQKAASQVVIKSLVEDANVSAAINKLSSDIAQSSKVEVAGLSLDFSSLLGIAAAVICILICCAGAALVIL